MAVLLKVALLLLAAVAAAQERPRSKGADLGPTYTLQTFIPVNNFNDRQENNFSRNAASIERAFSDREYFEWESYDGWFNNPAHPEWGGAGKPYYSLLQGML